MAYNYGPYLTIVKLLKYTWLKNNQIKHKNLTTMDTFSLALGFQREHPFFNHVMILPS